MSRAAKRTLRSVGMAWPWLALIAGTTVLVLLRQSYPQILAYPEGWTIPLADWINVAADWFVERAQSFFRAIAHGLDIAFSLMQDILIGLPWLTVALIVAAAAWQGGGIRLAALSVAGLLYILISGYWIQAMNTLSLVFVALPLAVMLGFVFGYIGYRSQRARWVIMPVLDLMQTIPAFAYLIPILLLFGFGPVVGLVASVIFAAPPMVRNTVLGFQSIPPAILESARMSGCTGWQRFLWAEMPTAWRQMLIGINQTTMATLSMVIIAAIIGGFDDIGWAVLSSMRKAQFGQSLMSGLVIVVMAILLDRITAAFAARQLPTASFVGLPAIRFFGLLAVVAGLSVAAGYALPGLWRWPEWAVWSPAQDINRWTESFLIRYGGAMDALKNAALYYVLLPVKIGLEKAIVPFTWGVTFVPAAKAAYWAIAGLSCLVAFANGAWRGGIAVVVGLAFLYFGATGLPWLSVLGFAVLLSWQLGGWHLSAFVGGGTAFLLVNGIWPQAMLSVYLCSVAVLICIVFGGLLGVWGASSKLASNVIRPVNDVLQTLPQFVLLIPALMLFQVGDFTALLAIVAYAIVPMVRYTEFGLRGVSPTLIDAGISSGCSPWQLFWQVRLPQALPQILIGVNQTVLYALGMLVIAALVGTTGLGQLIFLALGRADAGAGLVAGLGMALLAMMVDRILQAVMRRM
ncbi:ABC transporter permease [Roseovarius sp. Pro17]|uniref:ABC transporter permease n=1 Tax=Roseovarius sp. Pro17 TaxID=3108175 RepID=UPI002D795CC9|nr:ABC transporter permease subunit [Roseovarius sp. Pro17]